jgi:hypothetical protein
VKEAEKHENLLNFRHIFFTYNTVLNLETSRHFLLYRFETNQRCEKYSKNSAKTNKFACFSASFNDLFNQFLAAFSSLLPYCALDAAFVSFVAGFAALP